MTDAPHDELSERLLHAGGGIRLVRFRLRLALLAMFVIPLAIVSPILYGLARLPSDASLLAPTILIVLLALIMGALVAWVSGRVLEPAEELERIGHDLSGAYQRARAEAMLDPLTGLGNHRAFQEELDRQLAAAGRYGGRVTLAMLDLDGFKQVNDTDGHGAGDAVLAAFGRTMLQGTRKSDRCFRIGGDEFAILMPQTDAASAAISVRRILAAALGEGVATGDARAAGTVRSASFSAGLADYPVLAADRNEILRFADAALYWAKRHGRTAVHVFETVHLAGAAAARPSADLTAAVQRTTEGRLLRAVFQPIVDLGDGRVVGFEGLVRPLADSGFANPGVLFEAAEACGRTVELDMACLETVVETAARLGLEGHLGLNLSPRTLETAEFSASAVGGVLRRHGIEAARVVLEVTERETIEDIDRFRSNVAACRSLGLRVAADDVGAGNAGLRLLSQIRFDIVKIDLSLVQGGAMREASFEILRTLRDLAGRWQALVVAEGVETPEQLVVVRALGLTAAQGYLLGRPSDHPTVGIVDLDGLGAIAEWSPPPTPTGPSVGLPVS